MKLLVVEDNPRLSEHLRLRLQKQHIVDTARSGHEALQLFKTNPPECILLDLGLPDMPGLEVCKRIREDSPDTPILVLTGVDDTLSKVRLLEAGADDYVTKPFEAAELRARIDSLSRRRKRGAITESLRLGDLTLDLLRREAEREGTIIKLRRKEFDILEYLVRNEGRALSRQMIINHAWPSTSTSWSGSVDVHVKQIRDKIDKPFATSLIKTIYGVGYMIEAPAAT